MASFGVRTLALAIFVVVGILMLGNYRVSAKICQIEVSGLISKCSKFVSKSGPKIPPSPDCCTAIKPLDMPCACKFVTKDIENRIDMEKTVYVARTCGVDVPKGMKCGSYTIPDAWKEIVA